MKTISYKGYIIEAVPHQLVKTMKWTHNINIHKDTGSQHKIRNFTSKSTFDTEAEAIQHCFNFGKQIVDGKVPTCTVNDL